MSDSAIVPRKRYDPEALMPVICDRLAAGESLRHVTEAEGMPDISTVLDWAADPRFSQRYARAREIGWSRIGEELLDIADDGRNDWMERETKGGGTETVLNREAIERSRLRLDTRKWVLAKMLPKVYGDKLQVEATVVALAFARLSSPQAQDDE